LLDIRKRNGQGSTMAKHNELHIPESGDYVLRRARVPSCFFKTPVPGLDLDGEGSGVVDIGIVAGRIGTIAPAGRADFGALPSVDLEGRQVWATLIDMHTHLDKGQVIPRAMPDGTLDGGMTGTFEDRKRWTHADMRTRMEFGLRCAYAHGVSAIRTHLDSVDDKVALSYDVFSELRADWAGRIELQAVGLSPLTFFRKPWGLEQADRVAALKGVLGGTTDAIGHFDGAANHELADLLDLFFEIAGTRNLDVDLHADQSDNPAAYSLPLIAESVLRTGYKGRVVASHCVNLALQPDDVIARTIDLCAKAKIMFVTLPTPMMYLQDRKPGRTPRWRGVTAAQELLAAGIPVAIGGDNCRDAWFPFGDHDMVDTIQQSVRVFQLDAPVAQAVAMAGPIPSAIIGEPRVGWIEAGAVARLILFKARTLNELMCRAQSDRIVLNNGRRVSDGVPDYAELDAVM
jgi:cytosine/creatinine deaminase